MYRNEHPNPQFKRASYECLNGEWEFHLGTSGGKINVPLEQRIYVPFCVESELSGVGIKDFVNECVYGKLITLSESDLANRVVLHFGAVDFFAEVYLNGVKICSHKGGYTPFEAELNSAAQVGENRITVVVRDNVLDDVPSGKQSYKKESFGCYYTRCTGIWQTVWLERTPKQYIKNFRFYPDIENSELTAEVETSGRGELSVKVFYDGKQVGCVSALSDSRTRLTVKLAEKHLWEIGNGRLYDVEITFCDDKVYSYFGLRTVKYEGRQFLLNGTSVFQRLVLDQGYYPQGVYTAPCVEDIKRDIEMALRLGFNGARLHQKLFEPLYLYYCDKAGFIVWGEYASWGVKYSSLASLGQFVSEWSEAVARDFNHPCVVTWCPLNETWEDYDDNTKTRDMRYVEAMYAVTKILDSTRPCVDVSGGYHGKHTDVFDFHCYDSSEQTAKHIRDLVENNVLNINMLYAKDVEKDALYDGKLPINASEYGGVAYVADGGWGYRTSCNERDFLDEYVATTQLFLSCYKISGFCYTQLYDVEQEQNGLLTYDRKNKFSENGIAEIKRCNSCVAEIERLNKKGEVL